MKTLKNVFKKSARKSKSSVSVDAEAVDQLLTRGVDEVIGEEMLRKRLLSGEQLRVKLGIDPTSPNLHLGRSVPLLKLKDFQDLGHQVVFIIGDFTGVIGDTSDKDAERPMLAQERLKENMKTYAEQAGKILDMSRCEVHYNSTWLSKLGYGEIGEQADQFSVAEFIARDNIKRRLDAGKRVSLREMLYPLMQGYDSVAIEADVELGGTDQRFNLLAGRTLQEHFGQKPQAIMMNPLVEGTDGRKMSSSWGNTVNLTDTPEDMFGKIMSIPDELVIKYFTFMTRTPLEEIAVYEEALKAGENPRDIKMALAQAVVDLYHGAAVAEQAQEAFVAQFSKGEVPEDMPVFKLKKGMTIIEVLVESKLCSSNSDARRQIDGKGVRLDGDTVTDYELQPEAGSILQKGKRHYVRLTDR